MSSRWLNIISAKDQLIVIHLLLRSQAGVNIGFVLCRKKTEHQTSTTLVIYCSFYCIYCSGYLLLCLKTDGKLMTLEVPWQVLLYTAVERACISQHLFFIVAMFSIQICLMLCFKCAIWW